ncbi:hypothetical protein ACTOXX_34200 [Streptomyces rubiginosohelvolus]|uniref:hypothetical protein n=1 Tax=Streptomyces rubiginosohelvolus TaxID=67362 RepID=UPI003F8FD065
MPEELAAWQVNAMDRADEMEQLRAKNERMRHELEVMYGGAFDTPPAAPAAPEEPTPAPQCSAALLPATDEAVDRCVRHGAHDTHATAAGVRWPNDEDPEL